MITYAKWIVATVFLPSVVFFSVGCLADEERGPARTTRELERLIASTGIDPQRLLNYGGEGGPYVSLHGGPSIALDQVSRHGSEARARELRDIANILPLSAPLDDYGIRSGFGARVDPLTHKRAFHPGVDLTAPYRTPVHSTAPGVVTFAGVHGGYGKMVEIYHGHGVVTRFAHLHRISVVRGQAVGAHATLGELGSTGRSTGPHLHYEVLVNDDPVDPVKFLQAGGAATGVGFSGGSSPDSMTRRSACRNETTVASAADLSLAAGRLLAFECR